MPVDVGRSSQKSSSGSVTTSLRLGKIRQENHRLPFLVLRLLPLLQVARPLSAMEGESVRPDRGRSLPTG